MNDGIFKINLDESLVNKLRDTINSVLHLSMQKKYDFKKSPAFLRICAIMDRLYATAKYLNSFELKYNPDEFHSFKFCDFINNAYILKNCVDAMGKMFGYKMDKINSSYKYFPESRRNDKGNDCSYFSYLRSLASVHPIETDKHPEYIDAVFECSPYITWRSSSKKKLFLIVYYYDKNNGIRIKEIPIDVQRVFDFVEYRYSLLDEMIFYVKKYQSKVLKELQGGIIKTESEFYIDYLENLKNENEKRYPNKESYELKFAIRFFALKLTDPKNQKLYNKYANALRYAIQFKHQELQNMTTEGFKNCGLKDDDPDNSLDSTLLWNLCILHHDGVGKYDTPVSNSVEGLEVFSGLSDCNPDYSWNVSDNFSQAKPFLEQYVSFDGLSIDDKNDSFEFLALIHMALYQSCLKCDCSVNRNIPNNLKYRFKLKPKEAKNNSVL